MLQGNGWNFIHIPKCGGTSIRNVLRKECHFEEIATVLPMVPENTVAHRYHWVSSMRCEGRTFCFVRHPVAWFMSYWAMRMIEKKRNERMVLNRYWSSDFNTWARRVCQHQRGYVTRMFEAYTERASEIYRLEDGINPVLSDILGRKIEVEHRNSGKLPHCNATTRKLIIKSEIATIRKYGYDL